MKSRHGFTLIELSIVLVIIGLLVGGVLVGRDLIHAAEIRKTISQIEQTKTAVATFMGKYNCLPGDCPNASNFFSGAVNGDGDGKIYCNVNDPEQECLEPYNAWSQLSAAGLIAGSFLPMDDTAYDSNTDIQNYNLPPLGPQMLAPSTALAGNFLNINWCDAWLVSAFPALNYGNFIILSQYPYGDAMGCEPYDVGIVQDADSFGGVGLYPQDALAIDTKMDDGLPETGNVSVFSGASENLGCIPAGGANRYDMSAAGNKPYCAMYIQLGM